MDAGQLDRRVTILRRSLRNTPGSNEQREQFDELATVYAKVEPMSGREFFQASEVYQEETLKVTIRYRQDVNEKDRLSYRGRDYNLVHLAEIGRLEYLELLAVTAPH